MTQQWISINAGEAENPTVAHSMRLDSIAVTIYYQKLGRFFSLCWKAKETGLLCKWRKAKSSNRVDSPTSKTPSSSWEKQMLIPPTSLYLSWHWKEMSTLWGQSSPFGYFLQVKPAQTHMDVWLLVFCRSSPVSYKTNHHGCVAVFSWLKHSLLERRWRLLD